MATKPSRSTKSLAIILLLSVGVIVAFGILSVSNWFQSRYKQPLEYLADPEAVAAPVCPGDTFRYSFTSRILEEAVPLALTISRGIWSLEESHFVVGSRDDRTYPYVRPAVVHRTSQYQIPLTDDYKNPLPPGDYLLMVTGESEMRRTVGFEIPFTIAEGCP